MKLRQLGGLSVQCSPEKQVLRHSLPQTLPGKRTWHVLRPLRQAGLDHVC